MAYIYPLNNPGSVHLTVFDFTHLSPPPIMKGQNGPKSGTNRHSDVGHFKRSSVEGDAHTVGSREHEGNTPPLQTGLLHSISGVHCTGPQKLDFFFGITFIYVDVEGSRRFKSQFVKRENVLLRQQVKILAKHRSSHSGSPKVGFKALVAEALVA